MLRQKIKSCFREWGRTKRILMRIFFWKTGLSDRKKVARAFLWATFKNHIFCYHLLDRNFPFTMLMGVSP